MAEVEKLPCVVTGVLHPRSELRPVASLTAGIASLIRADFPQAVNGTFISRAEHARYRRQYFENLLETERGEISKLDREVLDSFESNSPVTIDPESAYSEDRTFGQAAADTVAGFGGSWTFILLFVAILVVWIGLNATGLLFGPFDPYPFILLNLALSCIAAFQAPIIMMSQRRQDAKDRISAENDYRVNLKAELEIRRLHEKLDHQMARQWERLATIQQVQIEMLDDVVGKEETP